MKEVIFISVLLAVSAYVITDKHKVQQQQQAPVEQPKPKEVQPIEVTQLVHSYSPAKESDFKPIQFTSSNYNKDLKTLTDVLFFETRSSNEEEYKAVFAVVMNRLHHKGFGDTVKEVVHKRAQFSYLTEYTPAQKAKALNQDKELYTQIKSWVHKTMLSKQYEDTTQGALYYYAHNAIKPPYWWDNQYKTIKTHQHTYASWHKDK